MNAHLDKRLLLLAGLVLFLSLGQRHSFGLYLIPVTQDLSWGRETFSMAIAIQNLVWGAAQPFSGALADKFGAKRVMIAGGFFYASGLLLMTMATSSLAFALTAGVLIGLGLSGTGFGIVYGAVGKEVDAASRPAALGIVGAIGGLGQLLMLPLNMTLINDFGWTIAALAISVVVATSMPFAMGIRLKAQVAATKHEESLGQALRKAFGDRDFWLLTVGFLSCGFQLAFIATHLPAYLLDNKLSPSVGTTALGVIALTNVAGTYLFGIWGARWMRKDLAVVLYVARAVALVLFVWLPLTATSVYIFAAAMGFLWLATVPLTNGILGQIYGMKYVNTLFGVVFLSHQIGSFLGVWLGGWFYDYFGNYTWVWLLAAALSALSAVLHFPIREARSRMGVA